MSYQDTEKWSIEGYDIEATRSEANAVWHWYRQLPEYIEMRKMTIQVENYRMGGDLLMPLPDLAEAIANLELKLESQMHAKLREMDLL